jgi:hypothetical protein
LVENPSAAAVDVVHPIDLSSSLLRGGRKVAARFFVGGIMKRPALCAALLLSIALTGGPEASAAKRIESSPTGEYIVLDGDSSDWEGIPKSYLEDSLHVAAIAHDDNSLYLMYRFADEGLARRILMRGVTLWINGNGKTKKKKEDFAVRYPGSEQIAEQFKNEDPEGGRFRPETDRSGSSGRGGPPPSLASLRQVPGQLTVIRMGMKETGDENDAGGPIAASTFNEGVFCYELKIPFSDIGGKIADASPAKKRQVAIGVQIGGMTQAEMEAAQAVMKESMGAMGAMGGRGGGGMGGAPPSGMGGGGIGGMGGGMGRGGMGGGGEMRNRLDPEITWLTVTLPAG